MARVALLGAGDSLTGLLSRHLERGATLCDRIDGPVTSLAERLASHDVDTVVYVAASRGSGDAPDRADATASFRECRAAGVEAVVVLSSTAVHAPSHKHPGRVAETYSSARGSADPLAAHWRELERVARKILRPAGIVLTILRPATVLLRGTNDYFNRLMSRRWAFTLAGHDPTLQFLCPEDLAAAVCRVVDESPGGVYHLVPSGAIPLTKALRLAGVWRLPVPRWLHRVVRAVAAPMGLASPLHQVDRLRYSWTASGEKAERKLGLSAHGSSAQAVRGLVEQDPGPIEKHSSNDDFDEFGLDKERIVAWGRRGHIRFLHDVYWRVELKGLENLRREGPGVMVGIHRGFMPFDGVMAMHAVVRETGRYPRFLIHPGLVKFPFLANYMFRLGGIIACRENADWVLRRDGLVAVFPEGIRGAFTYYRHAYELAGFGRPDYVRMALRHRAPILPFVTVGSAEIFPILKKLDWRWWKRYTEWPCFPLTPTFPLLPLPLPSKWHTQFLEPIRVHELYPPEAASDAEIVQRIDRQVQSILAATMKEMRERRRSVLYGSIFTREQQHAE